MMNRTRPNLRLRVAIAPLVSPRGRSTSEGPPRKLTELLCAPTKVVANFSAQKGHKICTSKSNTMVALKLTGRD